MQKVPREVEERPLRRMLHRLHFPGGRGPLRPFWAERHRDERASPPCKHTGSHLSPVAPNKQGGEQAVAALSYRSVVGVEAVVVTICSDILARVPGERKRPATTQESFSEGRGKGGRDAPNPHVWLPRHGWFARWLAAYMLAPSRDVDDTDKRQGSRCVGQCVPIG